MIDTLSPSETDVLRRFLQSTNYFYYPTTNEENLALHSLRDKGYCALGWKYGAGGGSVYGTHFLLTETGRAVAELLK